MELLIPITRIFIGADCLSAPAQIPASLSDPKKAVPPLFSRFTWQRNPISITRSYLISLGPDLYYFFFLEIMGDMFLFSSFGRWLVLVRKLQKREREREREREIWCFAALLLVRPDGPMAAPKKAKGAGPGPVTQRLDAE